MKPKRTLKPARKRILERLEGAVAPLAINELAIVGHPRASLQRRLYELKAEGMVECRIRPGTHHTEWRLKRSKVRYPHAGDDQDVVLRSGPNDLKAEACGSCGRRSCICRAERELERDEREHHDRF